MSSSPSFEILCERINASITSRLLRRDEPAAQFAPRGVSRSALNDEDTLRSLFDSLHLSEIQIADHTNINVATPNLLANIQKRDLYTFLAILIFSHCSFDALSTFAIEFLARDEDSWRKNESRLPSTRQILRQIFKERDVDSFLLRQPCLCPVVIGDHALFTKFDPEKQRLPYLKEELIVRKEIGQKAEIYRVIIAKGHFRYRDGNTNKDPKEIVRKDYEVDEEQMGHQTMKKILSADRSCPNIMNIFGILDIGRGEYSLFMPCALYDLKAYMEDSKAEPMMKSDIVRSLHGVARGLVFLHNDMMSDGDNIVCYHMDLKPKNILIFPENVDGKVCHVWKISDFGNSCVVINNSRAEKKEVLDSNKWFRKARGQIETPPWTVNQIGSTYLGPESLFSTPSMNAKSDVWSLGCIISVVFTYMEKGKDGIDQYAQNRMKQENTDRFFQRDRRFYLSTSSHPEVKEWHLGMIEQARHRSPAEGEALKSILQFVEKRVLLLEQSRRCDAVHIATELLKTQKMFKGLESPETPAAPEAPPVERRLSIPIIRDRIFGPRTEGRSRSEAKNHRWYLKTDEYFGGCDISPLGSIIALWNERKICLYTSEYTPSPGNRANKLAVAIERQIDEGCIWKNISLTDKYLVASVTSFIAGASVEMCYIFKLHNSSSASSIPIKFNIPRRVHMPFTIMKLIISLDNKTILCVLRDNAGSSLYEVPVAESETEYRRLRTCTDWPASEVDELSFVTNTDAYIVVRPRNGNDPRVYHYCLENNTLRGFRIHSLGPDYRSDAALFTTFVPFHIEPHKFAFITREKRLEIASCTGNSERTHADIRTYRIGKLMITSDDKKFYALGKRSGLAPMLLLELKVRRGEKGDVEGKEVEVREITTISDWEYDEVTVKLAFSRDGDNYRIMVVKKGTRRYEIRRIDIPRPNT